MKLKKFKWWWAWDSEKIEAWLEEMEAKGFRLSRVTGIGTVFHFEAAVPQKARYCIDFQHKLDKDYINLLYDDGWELIPMGAGWYVCRRIYQDKRPQLYTDYDSLMARNRKLMAVVIAACIPMVSVWPSVIENNNRPVTAFFIILCLLYGMAITKLVSANRLLKGKKELNSK